MLSTSVKPQYDALLIPPKWVPDPVIWESYPKIFQIFPFTIFFYNSFKITALVITGRLFFCSLAAYGFSRFSFPGRDLAFAMLIAAMMIPMMVAVIPLYIGYQAIGWINTHWPLIVHPAMANTFGVFLLRQFFASIPFELDESARIDGCSMFSIYWRIILPLSRPAFVVLAIFTFVETWNSFFFPLIFLDDLNKFTVAIGLAFFQDENMTEYPLLMAASTLSIIPILIFYTFLQKYFVQGVTLSGLKL
jgi:ABC-type glycerol-3-phosphate transport system permease component